MKNTLKIKVLGVEPSENLSAQANNNNIPTIKRYFNFQTAKEIKEKYGSASFFIANHTFSNVIDLSDFVDGVKHLLKEDGVFSMQTHYIKAVVEKNLIENFAHEHLSGFYVKPLKSFFERKGMEIFDVKIVPAKHGSIRCLIQKKNGPNKILPSVKEVIKQEEVFGMDKFNRHDSIAKFIKENKQKIHDYIDPILQKGGKIAAYGTSTGATTFSFNYDLGTSISFFVDDDEYRHNLLSPYYHIPVFSPSEIQKQKPTAIIVLAPLYADKIIGKNEDYLKQGGTFLKIWPKVEIIKN